MGEYFSGRVHSVVFENTAQDFYIVRMVLDVREDDTTSTFQSGNLGIVTVRGNIPGMNVDTGSWFGFEAKWETHETYGRQLAITKAPVLKNGWDTESALAMLGSHGVGDQVCRRLEQHFGDDLVEILNDGDEKALLEVPAITPFSAAHIIGKWSMIRGYFETLDFLTEAKVPKSKISLVWSTFDDDAKEVLSSNP